MTNNEASIGWNFDNSYARLPNFFYTKMNLNPVRSPELIILNEDVAKTLGLNSHALKTEEGIQILAGNESPKQGEPLAQAYAGHQFGHFTMLGDGRAILLGEQLTPQDERLDIQLKGSGRTPYSRGGDGRAALGPMLREYIISEAMHGLRIPTTRSLAVVTTGETILRETELPGAILTRVASSHLRVGTFQYAAQWGTVEELRTLADYTIKRHYPTIEGAQNQYLQLLREVMQRQASLIAQWQLVGFIHGVMNTDNMTISGETIDYGPCAFMDTYNPETVFSSIDTYGRYAYNNQPQIAGWNLARFAESLLPLFHDNEEEALELAQTEMQQFPQLYYTKWLNGMRAKLGIFNEEIEDAALVEELLHVMQKQKADYTNTFLELTFKQLEDMTLLQGEEFKQWHHKWHERLSRQPQSKAETVELMKNHNPAVIPRNHRVEEALDAAQRGDLTVMERLLAVLANPFAHTKEQAQYATLPAKQSGCYQTFCGT